MFRNFLSKVNQLVFSKRFQFSTLVHISVGRQVHFYKEPHQLVSTIQMYLVTYGIRMIMEYNLVSSRKKTFIDIQVTISQILETLLVTMLFFLDFEKHLNNPKRFFITDLAIISFPDHAFEFNERINPICLPYTSKDDGRFLQNTGLTISGNYQFLNLPAFD